MEEAGADVAVNVGWEGVRGLGEKDDGSLEVAGAEVDAGKGGLLAGETAFVGIRDFVDEFELREVSPEAIGVEEHALEAGVEDETHALALNRERDGEGLRSFLNGCGGGRRGLEEQQVRAIAD